MGCGARRAIALWAVFGVSAPLSASAFQHRMCNNRPVQWRDGRVPITIDTCSVRPGTRAHEAVWYALTEWSAIGGTTARFEVQPGGSCGVRHGDRRSTISYVDPRFVDDAVGRTRRIWSGGCWPWSFAVYIAEADVMIANDIERRASVLSRPVCHARTRPAQTEQNTVIHELGHALGLEHEDDEMGVMMTLDGEARFCGSRPFSPMPDDVAGVRALHRSAGTVRDLAASAFEHAGHDHVEISAAGERFNGCSGRLFQATYSVANLGNVRSSYRLRWYASIDDVLDAGDLLIGVTPADTVAAERFSTRRSTVRIDPRLPADTVFRLGYVIEPLHAWNAERRQGNNFTTIDTRVMRFPDWRCP